MIAPNCSSKDLGQTSSNSQTVSLPPNLGFLVTRGWLNGSLLIEFGGSLYAKPYSPIVHIMTSFQQMLDPSSAKKNAMTSAGHPRKPETPALCPSLAIGKMRRSRGMPCKIACLWQKKPAETWWKMVLDSKSSVEELKKWCGNGMKSTEIPSHLKNLQQLFSSTFQTFSSRLTPTLWLHC